MAAPATFRLRLITPARVVLDEEAVSVVAEDDSGCFGLRRRTERLAAALVPSILRIQGPSGRVKYAAVDRGVLRKEGGLVHIAVRQAVVGDDYRRLEALIRERLLRLEESELKARSAFRRLSLTVMLRLFGYERGRG